MIHRGGKSGLALYFALIVVAGISMAFRAADEFTAGAEQHDDMTLLIRKLAPALR